ncbi:mgtA regulatory leader peptide MgtL [Pluralibacter gergoviae]
MISPLTSPLTGGAMDPDPTSHHRWSNISLR